MTVQNEVGEYTRSLKIAQAEKKVVEEALREIDTRAFGLLELKGCESELVMLWKMRDRGLWKLARMRSAIKNIEKQITERARESGDQFVFGWTLPSVESYIRQIKGEIDDNVEEPEVPEFL